MNSPVSASPAFAFVLTMGVVNLFGDITYEGGASINGPFMASLGATAAVVSITAGLGEFLGYALRSVSGWAADKTGRYWAVTFVGYAINLVAVPAMALAGNWQMAAALVMAERIGRAIRKPTVEAMSPIRPRNLERVGYTGSARRWMRSAQPSARSSLRWFCCWKGITGQDTRCWQSRPSWRLPLSRRPASGFRFRPALSKARPHRQRDSRPHTGYTCSRERFLPRG
jgi:hypothetical protein